MVYRSIALGLMAIFYIVYLGKMFSQRMRGIQTDQMGKSQKRVAGSNTKAGKDNVQNGRANASDVPNNSETGKSKKVRTIEIIMKIATYSIVVVEVISIFSRETAFGFSSKGILLKVLGSYFALIGDVIFMISVVTMRDSWRAGINTAGDTGLVTKGIYAFSRNPAFLAFDLVYIGILMMYFNWVLLGFTIFAIVMLHIQILQEEQFLPKLFGEEYEKYKAHTGRYFGRGKWTFASVKCLLYSVTCIFSVLYYFTCVCYVGVRLSFVWIWLVLAVFCALRVIMLHDILIHNETGRPLKIRIPMLVRVIYHILAGAAVVVFMYVEVNVITYMNMTPEKNLDYVIVLGAGLSGTSPTRPLALRIQKASNYMKDNPDTILIASGGKGEDEVVSEASVIERVLVEQYGISADRIIQENASINTIANLKNSYDIIDADYEGEGKPRVGVVTNGFHIYRARLIAKEQGRDDVYGIPAQTLFPVGIHYVVREFFGVVQLILGWG